MNLSDEERKRRSEQAKELHARGVFGGPQPGSGRPRKRRASEIMAEKVAEHANELWADLQELREDRSGAVRLKALLTMLEIEERERTIQIESDRQLDSMRKDELLETVNVMLKSLQDKGLMPDTIEGTSTEIIGELEEGDDGE